MKKFAPIALLAALPFTVAYAATDVPAAIAVPAGHQVSMVTVGVGEITYECRAKADASGVYTWAFVAPAAVLYSADKSKTVGTYYGGPTWQANDGSKVTGKQLAVSPSPTPKSIPLQLVQAAPTSGSGEMAGVSYIQRLNTLGGVAPAEVCDANTVGAKQQVNYQADYVFYKP
ncbi:MAG: DUF3455 domain-containing protein [Pseudomonadota bacterium]